MASCHLCRVANGITSCWRAFSFPTHAGRDTNQIIDDYLRPVRDRIAHAVLDSGELTLSADEDLDIREIYKWLSLMKCIARHMLKSDFSKEFLPYLNEVGAYVPEHQ